MLRRHHARVPPALRQLARLAAAQLRVDAIGILALSAERWRDARPRRPTARRPPLPTQAAHAAAPPVLPIDATAASISLAVLELAPTSCATTTPGGWRSALRRDHAGRRVLPASDRLRAARSCSRRRAVVCEPTGADVDASHAVARWPGGARLPGVHPRASACARSFRGCARAWRSAPRGRAGNSLYEIQVRRVAHEWSLSCARRSDLSSLGLHAVAPCSTLVRPPCGVHRPGRAGLLVDGARRRPAGPGAMQHLPFEVQIAARPGRTRAPADRRHRGGEGGRGGTSPSPLRTRPPRFVLGAAVLQRRDGASRSPPASGAGSASRSGDAERIIRRYRRRLLGEPAILAALP